MQGAPPGDGIMKLPSPGNGNRKDGKIALARHSRTDRKDIRLHLLRAALVSECLPVRNSNPERKDMLPADKPWVHQP